MPIDKKRIPPESELRLLLSGFELAEAKKALENAVTGDEGLEGIAHLLRCDIDDIPDELPQQTDPRWVKELMFAIKAHRIYNGV
jgi:hypothetical protein